MNKEVVIVSAARTPIGSFLGSLSSVPAPKLGSIAIKGALEKINLDPKLVQEVLMGNVVQAGVGQAPARQAALAAGIPETVPCTTINKVCASGMKAVMQGAQAIALGDADIIMENMSLIPHYMHLRNGQKFGPKQMEDGMQRDGLVDAYDQNAMGVCADLCAKEYEFSREDQDAFAIKSYERSKKAWEEGRFDDEVVPVEVPQRRGEPLIVKQDEEFKNGRMDKISSLVDENSLFFFISLKSCVRPISANGRLYSLCILPGAGAVLLMSKEKAEELGLTPLATIKIFADAAQEPKWFTTSPAKALPKAIEKAGITQDDIDFFEFNEAFSVVGLANMKILGLSDENVNVNGGAVSLGHPLGCSGVRIIITLLNVLKQNDAKLGAAAICNGGGGASAMVIERN